MPPLRFVFLPSRDRGFPVRAYCRLPPHRPARLEKASDSDTEVPLRLMPTLAGWETEGGTPCTRLRPIVLGPVFLPCVSDCFARGGIELRRRLGEVCQEEPNVP